MEDGDCSCLHSLQHGHAEGSVEGQKVTRKQKNDVAVQHGRAKGSAELQNITQEEENGFSISARPRAWPCSSPCSTALFFFFSINRHS